MNKRRIRSYVSCIKIKKENYLYVRWKKEWEKKKIT